MIIHNFVLVVNANVFTVALIFHAKDVGASFVFARPIS